MRFPRYDKYKDSGVKWLGEIPDHWVMPPLWTLFKRNKRTNFQDEQLLSVYRDFGVIPKADRNDNFNKASEDLSAYQLVDFGDLTINKMKAWQGSVAVSEYRGIVSPAYFVYEAMHRENSRYLHYLMRSPRYVTGYLSLSQGIRVNQWDLQPNYHRRMPVVLPTLLEQTQIARFLDHETSKIDALIREQERLIELLQEKRQAVISHAVTKGLDPDVPMKNSGVEWLGEVPEGWDVAKLKHVLSEAMTYGANESAESDNRDFPRYIRITDLTENGGLREDTFKSLPWEKSKGYLLSDGDILLARSGATVGKSFLYRDLYGKACYAGYLIKARCEKQKVLPDYIYAFLQSHSYWEYIGVINIKATIQNVSAEKYGNLYMPIPSLKEQREILPWLEQEVSRTETLVEEAKKTIKLMKERRSALISAAVTGKIDVRGWKPPADESAFAESGTEDMEATV